MRELLAGADAGGWGRMRSESAESASLPTSPKQLGRTLYRGLVEGSDTDWESAFVAPKHYASLVEVSLERARKFADDKQGAAEAARESFAVDHPSEAPANGLSSIFALEQLKLGEGRDLEGDVAGENEPVVQYWDNRLELSLKGDDVVFEVRIPKIVRIPGRDEPEAPPGEALQLGVASTLRIGPRLRVFLETGMHLKPELLRTSDYPIPLSVGNFWRYARTPAERVESGDTSASEKTADSSPPTDPQPPEPGPLEATSVTVKVRAVDRYGTRRLVELRWMFNDADLTRTTEHWLVTPRDIFLCPRPCRRRVDDLGWLLGFLRRQTPIFRFPLGRGRSWGAASGGGDPTFSIEESWRNLDLPAGSFFGVFEIRGTGPLDSRVPFRAIGSLRRSVAPGTGVVRRRYRTASGAPPVVDEVLADYRLMTR